MEGFKVISFSVLASVVLLGMACSTEESSFSGQNTENDIASYAAEKNGSSEALDELGWAPSRRLTPDEEEILDRRMKLKRMESHLTDMRERDQYFKFKPYLDNDDERINFLSLPNMDARDRYAMEKGIYYHANRFAPAVRDAISRSDIILGMNKDAVVESWGEPATVEVAGQEVFGNERWSYIDYIETPEGYQRQERIVIFESGKVAGWQRR